MLRELFCESRADFVAIGCNPLLVPFGPLPSGPKLSTIRPRATGPRVRASMITLDIISPSGERQRCSFDSVPVSIGRQVGQLRIQDPGVSALHGQLSLQNGALCYRDLGSTNGSFGADGSEIRDFLALHAGDRVRLGEHELCLVEFANSPTPPPAQPLPKLTNKTMVYSPADSPWGNVKQAEPWQAGSTPSQEAPRPLEAPQQPRMTPAQEGTLFGHIDAQPATQIHPQAQGQQAPAAFEGQPGASQSPASHQQAPTAFEQPGLGQVAAQSPQARANPPAEPDFGGPEHQAAFERQHPQAAFGRPQPQASSENQQPQAPAAPQAPAFATSPKLDPRLEGTQIVEPPSAFMEAQGYQPQIGETRHGQPPYPHEQSSQGYGAQNYQAQRPQAPGHLPPPPSAAPAHLPPPPNLPPPSAALATGSSTRPPALQDAQAANTKFLESVRLAGGQPIKLLLSGPFVPFAVGGVLSSLIAATGIASFLVSLLSLVIGLGCMWALLPQSIAAAQLLSGEKITPIDNWIKSISLPPQVQARWAGLVLLLCLSSILILPLFLFYPFASPALLLERKGPVAAMRRSMKLVSEYPVPAMVPLLLTVLCVPLCWFLMQRMVAFVMVNIGGIVATLLNSGLTLVGSGLVALAGALYLVHAYRVYFYHLSVKDPNAPELFPLRRLENLR